MKFIMILFVVYYVQLYILITQLYSLKHIIKNIEQPYNPLITNLDNILTTYFSNKHIDINI